MPTNPSTPARVTTVDPTTGSPIADYPLMSSAEIDAALDAAVAAQRQWRTRPVAERADVVRAVAVELRRRVAECAALITREMGKPVTEARAEVEKSAITLDYYADHAERLLAFEELASNATRSGVRFDPLGVVLAIMPWNYPFWQFFRFAAPALVAGNSGVLKHAANVAGCAALIMDIAQAAGVPDGLLANLVVGHEEVAAIIADDRIAAVTLTGSTEVGAVVAAQAGAALKKQVLELGGSDPFIVLADADLAAAAATAVKARFTNGGQSCVNSKRFLVAAGVADEFERRFVAGARALVMGDPTHETTQIGPMAREGLRATLHHQVERSIAAGARLVLGGVVPEGPGAFYPPTVLVDVPVEAAAFAEETFGPVAAITRVADAEEALSLANTTEFGLAATVFTADAAVAEDLAARLEAGAVFVNGQVASDARLPFGGIKRSGYGRELAGYGLKEFVNIKTVWIGPAR